MTQGRKRLRQLTKGFRAGRHHLYRQSVVALIRARVYAFRDRRVRKREFRQLWIIRINAACRSRGMRYSQLIHGLQLANIGLNRKTLADLAIADRQDVRSDRGVGKEVDRVDAEKIWISKRNTKQIRKTKYNYQND